MFRFCSPLDFPSQQSIGMAKKTLPPIVLPVVRIERNAETLRAPGRADLTNVVDLNAFRYSRERAVTERRSSKSLLPELGPPCDVGETS
jgi:hypothetical protein